MRAYACPCCGYLTLAEAPGSYEVCPVCLWEDDPLQLRDQDFSGGANRVSLNEGRRNFRECGASSPELRDSARKPRPDEYPGAATN